MVSSKIKIHSISYLTGLFLLLMGVALGQTTVNAYARVTSISGSSVLALSNVNIANHTFTVGGSVIIMQMQDDVIGTNTTNAATFGDLSAIGNAGRYEIRVIAAVTPTSGTPTSVTLSTGLANTYNTGSNSSVQMISFRDLGANYTTTANISGLAWNGNVGGVLAFSSSGTLTLNHRILADGLGFRGGLYSNDNGGPTCSSNSNTLYIANNNLLGFKGEGIYRSTTNTYNNARGKIINAGGGGNDHNAGGGGGGNYTAGGQGGNGYNNCTTFPGGGLGGISLSAHISASRVFMGGAGGGGQQNNTQNSAGGNGGGIILIKTNVVATSTTCGATVRISANGANAINGGNDGMGGGGAAGSIVIEAASFSVTSTCPLTVRANGGDGGDCTDGASHAGGGGGGQGVIIYSSAQPTLNVTTQANNGTAGQDNSGGAVSAGAGGGTNGSGIITASSGPLPIELIEFKAEKMNGRVLLSWSTASEKQNAYFTVEKSLDGLNYTFVASVEGSGNSNHLNQYSVYDDYPSEDLSYYRLKQTDYDGAYKYSPIVSFEPEELFEVSVSPNPSKRGESISFVLGRKSKMEDVKVQITDLAGLVLYKDVISTSESTKNKYTLTDFEAKEGVYFLKVQKGNATQIKKVLVE